MNNRPTTAKSAIVLLVFTFIAYAGSFHAPFQYDDYHQIAENEHIKNLSNIPEFFTEAGTGSQFAGTRTFRPLLLTSLALNRAVSGRDVWSYHLVNVMLHYLCTLLVWLVVRRVMDETGGHAVGWAPLMAALAFAAHPVQTGAVTYVSGRSEVGASMFVLAGLYCFMRYRGAARHGYFWLAASASSFLLGLLTKEMAVCLLGLLPAYDIIVRREKAGGWVRALPAYVPFLAVFAAYMIARRSVLGYSTVDEFMPSTASYLMSMPRVVLMYIRLVLLPVNQNADYNLPLTEHPGGAVVVCALALAAFAYWLIRMRRYNPASSFFGLWFFIALAPESSVFPILDIAVEYRVYLASAGLIACATALVPASRLSKGLRVGLPAVLLACLCLLTINRASVWASTYSLWSDVAKKSPWSARAHINLGNSLADMGRNDEAVSEFMQAARLGATPYQRAELHNNIGTIYLKQGRQDEALGQFEEAISEAPGMYVAYSNAAGVYFGSGRYEEALGLLTEADRLNPGRPDIMYMLAWTYWKTGREEEGRATMEKAFSASPGSFSISLDLARFYMMSGMEDRAALQGRIAASLAKDEKESRQAEDLMGRLGRK